MSASIFDLSSLNGNNGFRLDGEHADDSSGISVSSAGDVNGDGFSDVIVGAFGADPNGDFSGSSYVVFGKASGFDAQMDVSSLDGRNGFRLDGEHEHDNSGCSVSGAGDVNNDGFDDLIIGAFGADPNGSSYVVFGKASGFDAHMNLSSLDGSNGFRLDGVTAGDKSGYPVSNAGDIDGDGFDDLLIGAPRADSNGKGLGSSYVVFGHASGFDAAMDLSGLDGSNGFRLDIDIFYSYTNSVSSAGDVNGDGFDDLIFGVNYHRYGGGHFAGITSFVVFGKNSGFDSTLNLSNLDGNDGFRLTGASSSEYDGSIQVSSAGDINGDGLGDLIVGTPNILGFYDEGASYVIFGQTSGFDATLDLARLDGSNGFSLSGLGQYNSLGKSVSDAGDVNGDGFGDLIIGAPRVNNSAGSSYVLFGKASGFDASVDLFSLDGSDGVRLDGTGGSGSSVSGAGDVNGDGFDDLIVGAPFASLNGVRSASSYIVFGSRDFGQGGGGLPEIKGTEGDDTLKGSTSAEHFIAKDGNDNLLGLGGADVFDAGTGNDAIRIGDLTFASIDGGGGNDALHLAGSGMNLDLTVLGDQIHNIETICLYGRGDNALTLTAETLLNLSDSTNTLKVHGNSGDHIVMQDSGWIDGGSQGFYHTYTHDDAVLLVGANVTVEFV